MKKRIVLALVLGLILALAMGGTALAHPGGSHHHHIHLPNGTCLEITSFHKGMHHASETPAAVDFHHEASWGHTCPD